MVGVKADLVFWFLVAVLLLWVTGWFVLLDIFFRTLAHRHPELFRQLGEPRALRDHNPLTSAALMRFLFRGEDRRLDDPSVTMLAHALIIVFAGYMAVFIGFLALLVALVTL